MTEVVKMKAGIAITLVLQAVTLAYFFGAMKAQLEGNVKECLATVTEVKLEQKNRTYLTYKVEELVRAVEEMKRRVERP